MRLRSLAALAALILCAAAGRAAVVGLDETAGNPAVDPNVTDERAYMDTVADMTPVADDPGSLFTSVSSLALPSPFAGNLTFGSAHSLRQIGSGWNTWSHGYTGKVYALFSTGTTYTLPTGVSAFDFYVEPNDFDTYSVSATSASGTVVSQAVTGASGAKYFGFYGALGEDLTSVTLSVDSAANGYAIGEFRVGKTKLGGNPVVPEPGTLALLAGGLAMIRRRRRGR